MINFRNFAVLGAAIAAFAPFATAAPIPITSGSTVTTFPAGGTTAAAGPMATTYLFDSGYLTLTAPTFSAHVEETAFRDSNNVLCAGCITFAVQFSDIMGSPNAIEHYTIGSFSGFLTDVGYLTGTGTANAPSTTDAAPVTVDETLGGTLSFNFSAAAFTPVVGIQPGNMSDVFFVETNATAIQPGFAALIDSTSVNMNVMVPAATPTVPEPSSLMLLGSGLVSAAGMVFRRRRTV